MWRERGREGSEMAEEEGVIWGVMTCGSASWISEQYFRRSHWRSDAIYQDIHNRISSSILNHGILLLQFVGKISVYVATGPIEHTKCWPTRALRTRAGKNADEFVPISPGPHVALIEVIDQYYTASLSTRTRTGTFFDRVLLPCHKILLEKTKSISSMLL